MTTATEARAEHLAARERYRPAPETVCCPECGDLSYVKTGGQPATKTDPAWQTGYCTCAEKQAEVCAGDCMDEECCGCRYED